MDEKRSLRYFRIKTEYTRELDNGQLSKVKIEELVLATTYTEAESLAVKLADTFNRSKFGSFDYEIIRTKIADVLFNDIFVEDDELTMGFVGNAFLESEDSGVGLYSVKVVFISIDEKTAKEKRTTEVFYVPASSNSDATNRVNNHLKNGAGDYVIRDTKFDRAEAIYWPKDVHQNKVSQYELS